MSQPRFGRFNERLGKMAAAQQQRKSVKGQEAEDARRPVPVTPSPMGSEPSSRPGSPVGELTESQKRFLADMESKVQPGGKRRRSKTSKNKTKKSKKTSRRRKLHR